MSYVSQAAIYESALREAQSIQREEGKKAKQKVDARQKQLDDLARRRTALAQQQAQRRAQLQAQADAALAGQRAQADRLRIQQNNRLSQMAAQDVSRRNAIKAQTAQRVAEINRAGGAAATSLRILAQEQPMGPNAQQTPRNKRRRAAGTTSANVARGSSSIRGTNLSI